MQGNEEDEPERASSSPRSRGATAALELATQSREKPDITDIKAGPGKPAPAPQVDQYDEKRQKRYAKTLRLTSEQLVSVKIYRSRIADLIGL